MRIYISGKITGLPLEEAKAMFQAAEDFLIQKYKNLKVEVINPFKLDHSKAEEMEKTENSHIGTYTQRDIWIQYMKEDLGAVLNSDGLFMLVNWVHSQGARIEHAVAKELGLTVEYEQ